MSYIKYYVYKKQQQVNGQWVDVYPAETKPDGYPLGTYNTLAQCQGYVPPTPTGATKFRATYAGGSTYELECDGNTTLGEYDIKPTGYTASSMTSAYIGDCVTSIGSQAFSGCTNLKRLNSDTDGVFNIPSNITSISNSAFEYCTSLTSIDIPNGVTSIGVQTFMCCSGLTDVNIPNSVTIIDMNAFLRCTGLTTVNIPSGVTSIGQSAFQHCSSLASIVVPASVTDIDNYAFWGCSSLTQITCLATTPPTLGDWVFVDYNSAPIYVPAASLSAYQSSWSDYSSRIVAIQ